MRLCLLFLLGLLAGCNLGPGGRGDDDSGVGDDDDDAGDDDDSTPTGPVDATLQELNAGDVPDGTQVVVTGAVVTSPLWDDKDDNQAGFWIQQGTGLGAGMLVFTYPDIVAELEASVVPGAVVTVRGTYTAPFGFGEITVTTADRVEVTGTGTLPEPYVVEATALAGGFYPDGALGLVVAVEDVEVDEAPGWDNYFEWAADGVLVDGPLYQGEPWLYADVRPGYTMDRLSGVLHLDFGNAKLFPRWQDDLDYAYPGCVDLVAPSALQQANCRSTPVGDDVAASGLVVVSPEPWFGGAFYAMAPDGADFSGTQVYLADDEIGVPDIGAVITLSGLFDEYRGQSEIVVFDGDDLTETGTTAVVPVGVDDVCAIDERHEGLLVQVDALTVRAQDGDAADFGYFEVDDCPWVQIYSEFFDDADAFNAAAGGAGEVTELIGVVTDRFDTWRINPRSADDWASWAAAR